MSTKVKFQVGKILDQRIKNILADSSEERLSKAYILGFINGNSINYVGLAKKIDARLPGLEIMGLAYFDGKPSDDEIRKDIGIVTTWFEHALDQGNDKFDLLSETINSILNSFLVYFPDDESTTGLSRAIWTKDGPLDKPPKISVLESNKIYGHSAIARLNISIRLDLSNEETFNKLLSSFVKSSQEFLFTIKNSKFSTKSMNDKSSSESLYDHIIPPDEVTSIDDVLSQVASNKKEKELALKKVCDKWRNKQKERRAPFEFEIKHDESDQGGLMINLELYHYVHIYDSISYTLRKILSLISLNLHLVKSNIDGQVSKLDTADELKFCSFRPDNIDHFVYNIYLLRKDKIDYNGLEQSRRSLHESYLAPMTPLFRISNAITNIELKNHDEQKGYLCNVHRDIVEKSGINGGLKNIIGGSYTYHHYMQNNTNDSGWGCAYRSLQTIISWFKHQAYIYSPDIEPFTKSGSSGDDKMNALSIKLNSEARVPTHEEIQTVLVDIGDKNQDFIGSKKWIGSQEVCFVLDHLYGISSKFIAVSSGSEIVSKARDLGSHFKEESTPVMIGGGVLAHTIIGTDFNEKNGDISYLILDPHYTDDENLDKILKKGWCGWKKNNFWDKSAFYNLCLPQRPKVI